MASRVTGILESIHSRYRPVLCKFESDTFFGITDLRMVSIFVGTIQLLIGIGVIFFVVPSLGIFYLFASFLLVTSSVFKQKTLVATWLLLMVCCELFLCGLMIINVVDSDADQFWFNFFSYFFYLIGLIAVYSFYMKMDDDLPITDSAV